MRKLIALLVAATFSLTAAMPASAAPAGDSLEIVPAPDNGLAKSPAPKAAKSVKKHQQVKKAKHKPVRKAKHKRAKVRVHKR